MAQFGLELVVLHLNFPSVIITGVFHQAQPKNVLLTT